MVYVTGDLHGDLTRLKSGPARKLKKGDTLIVCGDFGFLWYGDKRDTRAIKALSKLRYNVLFLDGIHENYAILDKFPIEPYANGNAQKIADNVYHLLRGEIYTIEEKTFFTFGGGESEEEAVLREDSGTHWDREMPSGEEMTHGMDLLKAHNQTVDYVLTHFPSGKTSGYLSARKNHTVKVGGLHVYLNQIEENVTFKHWYFGSMHWDKCLGKQHTAVFLDVLKLD